MKQIALNLLLQTVLGLGVAAHADTLPPGVGKIASLDTSVTTLPTTYTTGGQFFTSLTGKSHISVVNHSSTDLAICLSSTVTNCASGTDNGVVPASGAATYDNISINSKVCIRSLGSAITSGVIRATVW